MFKAWRWRKESCGREDEQEAFWENCRACERKACVWGARQPSEKSLLENQTACGSRDGPKETATERCERSNLEMIVAVPWRKNEDDEKMDGERLEGEVVLMDKDFRDKLEMEEHVSVSKRACISREDIETFGFTARCIGCLSIFKGTARQAHTKGCRRRIEGEMPDTVEAEAVQRRVKEYQTRQSREQRNERSRVGKKHRWIHPPRARAAVVARHWHQVQAAVATQHERSGPHRTRGPARWATTGKQMANSPDDLERKDGKWMRAEGNKRKTVDEEQEAEEDMIKKTSST